MSDFSNKVKYYIDHGNDFQSFLTARHVNEVSNAHKTMTDHAKRTGKSIIAKDSSGKVIHKYNPDGSVDHTEKMNIAHETNTAMKTEEVEQLDELKKSTLMRYISKSGKDSLNSGIKASRALDSDDRETWAKYRTREDKRDKGVALARYKLTKKSTNEEVEQLDEIAPVLVAAGIRAAAPRVGSFVSKTFKNAAKKFNKDPEASFVPTVFAGGAAIAANEVSKNMPKKVTGNDAENKNKYNTSSLPPAKPAAKPVEKPNTQRQHSVNKGDNLDFIARKYKVSGGWQTLAKNNPHIKDPTLIKPGDKINLPDIESDQQPKAEVKPPVKPQTVSDVKQQPKAEVKPPVVKQPKAEVKTPPVVKQPKAEVKTPEKPKMDVNDVIKDAKSAAHAETSLNKFDDDYIKRQLDQEDEELKKLKESSKLPESFTSIKMMMLENIKYDITESVSYDSKKYYEMSEGKKPSGNGNWSFSTIRPTRHDSSNKDHMENTFSQTGNFSDVVRNAVKHFKSKGHTGEIHLLS